jgi:hypothetical protein
MMYLDLDKVETRVMLSNAGFLKRARISKIADLLPSQMPSDD